jgi:hypothetical protein
MNGALGRIFAYRWTRLGSRIGDIHLKDFGEIAMGTRRD